MLKSVFMWDSSGVCSRVWERTQRCQWGNSSCCLAVEVYWPLPLTRKSSFCVILPSVVSVLYSNCFPYCCIRFLVHCMSSVLWVLHCIQKVNTCKGMGNECVVRKLVQPKLIQAQQTYVYTYDLAQIETSIRCMVICLTLLPKAASFPGLCCLLPRPCAASFPDLVLPPSQDLITSSMLGNDASRTWIKGE